MTGVDAEPLRELPVGELPLAFLAQHLEDSHAERVSQRFQLLRFVEYERVLHGPAPAHFYI